MTTTTWGTAGEVGGRIGGGVLGGAIGGVLGGPIGAWIGRAIGSRVGGWAGRAGAEALATMMEDANENAETQTKAEAGTKADQCKTGDCKQQDPCAHLRRGNGNGPYRGGAHGEMRKPTGDSLDSHHMPAKDALPQDTWNDLPAIQMDPTDHGKTMSNGNKGAAGYAWRKRQADLVGQGKFDEAMQMDIDDARRIARETGDPTKYDEAIKEAEEYAKCREKNGLNKPKGANSPSPSSAPPTTPGPSGPDGPPMS